MTRLTEGPVAILSMRDLEDAFKYAYDLMRIRETLDIETREGEYWWTQYRVRTDILGELGLGGDYRDWEREQIGKERD